MELNKIKEPGKLQIPGRILGIAAITIASVACSSQPEFEVGAYWRGSQTADFVDPNTIDYGALNGGIDYFAAPLSPTGDIETRDPDFRATYDKEVNEILEKTRKNNVDINLTIPLFDTVENPHAVKNFVNNKAAQDRSLKQIMEQVKRKKLNGISIDFESMNQFSTRERKYFVDYIQRLQKELKSYKKDSELTIAVNPQAAIASMLWDLKELSKICDGIVMMAYEYGNPFQDYIMPTAPLYGAKEGKYWYDVSSAVEDFLKVIPANKLILGIPLFGHKVTVRNPAMNEEIIDGQYYTYAQAADFVKKNKDKPDFQRVWSDYARMWWYYLPRTDGLYDMVVVDGKESIIEKIQYAKAKKLKGVVFWSLDQATYSTLGNPDLHDLWDNVKKEAKK